MRSPKTTPRNGRKKNPFEFDAPRFTDFTRKHFVTTKELLEDALRIPKSARPDVCTSAEFMVTKLDKSWHDGMESNENCPFDNDDYDDDWFERSHPSHEPTSPLTPPGPLITPNPSGSSNRNIILDQREYNHQHTPTNRRTRSSGASSITAFSDSKASSNAFGLRSRPLRILNNTSNPSSSHRGSLLKNRFNVTPRRKEDHRSSNMTRVTFDLDKSEGYEMDMDRDYDNRMSASSNAYTMTGDSTHEDLLGGRISSLPSLDGWLNSSASFLPSPPKCRLPIEDEEPTRPHISVVNVGLRKLGPASRATRVQVNIEEQQGNTLTTSKHVSPDIKRVRTDSKFCPAPSALPHVPITMKKPTTDKPAKIDDLKKILAEHNQRLRPRKQR